MVLSSLTAAQSGGLHQELLSREQSVATERFCSEGHGLVVSDISGMPQTIPFVVGDNLGANKAEE